MPAVVPALPYPRGLTIHVYEDDGGFEGTRWFMRAQHVLNALYRATITLAHYEGEEEPCYTAAEWCRKADSLLEQYPNCVFIYTGV